MADQQVFFIGVTGGTASGKTSVCNRIVNDLGDVRVALINMDSFYKGLEAWHNPADYNFDHPDAFDYDLFFEVLTNLSKGKTVDVPVYDFKTHSRSETEFQRVAPTPVIIVEGILTFFDKRIRDMLHMKIFVDTDADVRLLRRVKRDIAERGRTYQSVLHQYERFVKPAYDEFIAPSKRHADIIIPHWPNEVAVDLIVAHVRAKIGIHDLRRVFPNLKLMPHSSQCRQLHTRIRDAKCSRTDFVFYADRLIRMVVEYGLGLLPFHESVVKTPMGGDYIGATGPEFEDKVCAVSLVRAGESMEAGLMSVCKNIRIGKILLRFNAAGGDQCGETSTRNAVQSVPSRERPEVVYLKLPQDIEDRYVFLCDPVVGEGLSAVAAIKILLRKGVKERNIIFLTLLAAPEGIQRVCTEFPHLKVVTTEIDRTVDENGYVLPGVGTFADRYFGTEGTQANYEVSPLGRPHGASIDFGYLKCDSGLPAVPPTVQQ